MTPEETRDQDFRRWMDAGHCPRCGRTDPLTVVSLTNDQPPIGDRPWMICVRCGQEELAEEPEYQSRSFWPAHFVRIAGS